MTVAVADDEVEPDATAARAGRLVLDLEGFEGPIDLLLTLARDQKVDLGGISILRLADQYLAFIAGMRREQLELAADYLVMAAWLAYLKSRLLLPEPPAEDEPSPEEMAAALQLQLQRLEAMQTAGKALLARPQLGRDVFPHGAPEGIAMSTKPVYDTRLYDLLKAYADFKRRTTVTSMTIEAPDLWSVDDAMHRLRRLLGRMPGWSVLAGFLPPHMREPLQLRSAVAATFVAVLEMAKQGRVELRQEGGVFSPLYVRPVPVDDALIP